MAKKFTLPRGTNDILPGDAKVWQELESIARKVLSAYGYCEIRTPVFEETELFARSMGQSSDVVKKQMLTLQSQKQTEATDIQAGGYSLRPEGTASVVRSYIQNSFDRKESLSKLFYIGSMFRGERPQKGRLRQFHQIGAEAIGPDSASPYLDAEVISLSVNILKGLGLKNYQLKINTLGSKEDKENFSKWLRAQLKSKAAKLSKELKKSLDENVFRILDSKDRTCQAIVDELELDHSYLSEESKKYFAQVKEALNSLNVKYEQSPRLVRGLDYYTHTVFEITDSSLGAQDALGAGGRYGSLVEQLGGPEVDAIGFALGIERILLVMPNADSSMRKDLDVFIISTDEVSFKRAYSFLNLLRQEGVSSEMNYRITSMKSQMRLANKSGARYVMIFGEEEVKNGVVTIKEMDKGTQVQEKITDINSILRRVQEK